MEAEPFSAGGCLVAVLGAVVTAAWVALLLRLLLSWIS